MWFVFSASCSAPALFFLVFFSVFLALFFSVLCFSSALFFCCCLLCSFCFFPGRWLECG